MRLYKHRVIKDPYISPKATSSHTIRLQAQHQKKYKRSSRCAMWEQRLAPISKSVDCWSVDPSITGCWALHGHHVGKGRSSGHQLEREPLSHCTLNQGVHWLMCASARFSCPCFSDSQTSVLASHHWHLYLKRLHLEKGWKCSLRQLKKTHM